jgi:hypothetical protein
MTLTLTLIVNLLVAIAVCCFDHGLDVLLRQVLTEIAHGLQQLLLIDQPVAVDVKDAESLTHLVLLRLTPHLRVRPAALRLPLGHHAQELVKVYRSVACTRVQVALYFINSLIARQPTGNF